MTKENDYKRQNAWIKERYITVSAKLPREFVTEFKEACKRAGTSQSEVFRKAMQEVIDSTKE